MRSLWVALFALTTVSFSGCITTISDVETGSNDTSEPIIGFAPQEHFDEDMEANLHLSGSMDDCQAGFCLDLLGENEGNEPYYVSDTCVRPFQEIMLRDGIVVEHREPTFCTQQFHTTPLRNGAPMRYQTAWDEKLWSDSDGYYDAPQGEYIWRVSLRAYQSSGGDGPVQVEVEFPVILGET